MEDIYLFISLLLLFTFPLSTHSLTCESCQLTKCGAVTDCDAGMVMDVCNCCAVCAQAEGEPCGGNFDLNGKCGMNLYCYLQHTDVGTCKACEDVVFSGCRVVQGVCQCGNSCVQPFDYADRDSCLNSVHAQGSTDYCLGKLCPQDVFEPEECPEDSYRPSKKLSIDGCCLITQPCKCHKAVCHSPPVCPAGKMIAELSRGNGLPATCCSQYTCINATVECKEGVSTFANQMDSCMECECRGGIITCRRPICDTPSCEWAALAPGKCCPQCKGCVSARTGERYSNGETWKEDNSCIQCQCVEGQTHCTASACERRCLNAKKLPGHCCPICDEKDTYTLYNVTAEPLRTTTSECPDVTACPSNCKKKITVEINGCTVCICEDDINMCLGSTSCSKICPHGYKKDRELGCSYCRCNACPTFSCNLVCSDGYDKDIGGCNICKCHDTKVAPSTAICFTSEGRTYRSGDSWFDGCRQCYCESGREMCSLISCPPVLCSQPLVRSGDCCPSCPLESSTELTVNISMSCVDADGAEHQPDDVWQLDICTVCLCHQGHAFCESKRCPPTLCTHPIIKDGHCCPQCEDGVEPIQTSKDSKSCTTLSGAKFDHGSIWKIGDCKSCTCRDGTATCFSQTCPSLLCKTTVQQKGQCCPKCTAESTYDKICVYEGKWFTHLQSWEDNNLQCTCLHGQAECESQGCIPCDDDDEEGDKPLCCRRQTDKKDEPKLISSTVGLSMIIMLSILLLVFAAVIVLLSIIIHIMRKSRRRKTKLTAIPKILEKRAMHNACDALMKKRPKSTNLEFLHSTSDSRYNGITRGDADCFRPLVDSNQHGNEYVQC